MAKNEIKNIDYMEKEELIKQREPFIERVLIVDDDPMIRDCIKDLFNEFGYKARTVSNGTDAINILSKEYYPVVVTDLFLPDIKGIQILDFIQEKGGHSVVLIITAYSSADSAIEALRHGAYDYITKPFSSQILLHRVTRAMEKVRMDSIAQSLASRIVYATEEERRRISRDIHDVIGQSLAIIKLTLKALKNKLPQTDDIMSEIDGLSAHVEETMEEVSRISKELNPSWVVDVGFSKALRLYLETFSTKTGIQVSSALPDNLSFKDPQFDIHLYRITQEALTNIAKHSDATKIEISLEFRDSHVHFSISDNGKGFDESSDDRKRGLGLIGMRERATILGGRVSIKSFPGQGTTVKMEIPYGKQDS